MKLFSALIVAVFVGALMTSCKTTSKNVIYADYISFGDKVRINDGTDRKPYTLYDQEDPKKKELFTISRELRNIKPQQNTAGIYAMDNGLDRIKYVQKKIFRKDPNTKYYVIFMTDGLDNISAQLARNETGKNYKTTENYQDKMKKKIIKISKCNKKEKNDFTIYPIVFTGTDLQDIQSKISKEDFDKYLESKMGWMRGSSKGIVNSPEVIADTSFGKIKETFEDAFRSSGFEFIVPKGYVNQKIKMELKGESYGTDEISTYFTAVLKNKGKKYYLTDIKFYNGLGSADEKLSKKDYKLMAINNKDKKGTVAQFVLDRPNVKLEGRPDARSYFVYTDVVEQFIAEADFEDLWIKNSEYDSQLKSMVNAYVQLIVDCSASLGTEGFANEIGAASEMLKFISNIAGVEIDEKK